MDKNFSAFIDFLLSKCVVSKPERNLQQEAPTECKNQPEYKEWIEKKNSRRLPALRLGFFGFCVCCNYNPIMKSDRRAGSRQLECVKKRGELLRMCDIVKTYLTKSVVFNACRQSEELCF